VTIGRVKNNKIRRMGGYLAHYDLFETESFPVSEFALFSSLFRPKGAIYTREMRIRLGDSSEF